LQKLKFRNDAGPGAEETFKSINSYQQYVISSSENGEFHEEVTAFSQQVYSSSAGCQLGQLIAQYSFSKITIKISKCHRLTGGPMLKDSDYVVWQYQNTHL
jgi:hypothetical protein